MLLLNSRIKITVKYRIILLILPLFLVGCQSINRNQNDIGLLNWNYGDLRIFDAIDTSEPDKDLIAIYTRIVNQSFQIRLDFLDLSKYLGKDIYIPLDTNPGGTNQIKTVNDGIITTDIDWDYLIIITDSGEIKIVDNHLSPISSAELFIVYDSWQDWIGISCNKNAIPLYYGQAKLQVIITPINQEIVSDISVPFLIDSPSPSRAKVIFAFWNTFSSITPAQTLRSWAGAHAGPMSSRHGLSYLIDSVARTNSPVFLLDLLTPDNLSALDFINALPRIRELENQGLLILPAIGNIEVNPDTEPILKSVNNPIYNLDFYKIWRITSNLDSMYMMKNSDFILLLDKFILYEDNFIEFSVNDYAKYINDTHSCELLPFRLLNSGTNNLPSNFSIDCKRLLLSYAIAAPTTPLILGGGFSMSILGDPAQSALVFTYIHSHPWIQILSINDLVNYESSGTNDSNLQQVSLTNNTYPETLQDKVYEALIQSPKNQLTDLANTVFNDLAQSDSSKLTSLKSNYIGQIGFILAAAKWGENPISAAACDADLDYDGFSECVLSNESTFVIIEPDGGYIPMVFSKDMHGIHQLIGPTWEFVVGLGDAYTWNPDLGIRGDPAQLLGAFQDAFDNWNRYDFRIINNEVGLYDGNSEQKLFTLIHNSLHVDINNPYQPMGNSIIPLVVDPWLRYTSGWGNLYLQNSLPSLFQWGIIKGEMVEIRATNPLNIYSFNDTRASFSFPEDPNYDYPPGHYLPYPMSLVEISSTEKYAVDIIINP
jgi:hypothetical protein